MNDKDMMRIGDSDRELVSRLLKTAVDEGKLTLPEYDERLQEVLLAKTVGDLAPVTGDLIKGGSAELVAAGSAAPQLATAPAPARDSGTPAWVRWLWFAWSVPVVICTVIWLIGYANGSGDDFWPIWVAGPAGGVVLCLTGMERLILRPSSRRRDSGRTAAPE